MLLGLYCLVCYIAMFLLIRQEFKRKDIEDDLMDCEYLDDEVFYIILGFVFAPLSVIIYLIYTLETNMDID